SFTITNNYIGGSAPGATGTWTASGTAQHTFCGIYLNVGSSGTTSVQGNVIRNFSFTTASVFQTQQGIFSGIFVMGGKIDVGTVSGNTIGSGTGNANIDIILNSV